MHGGVYKRRTPEKSDLYKIAYQHFEAYEKIYPQRYEKEYGYFSNLKQINLVKKQDNLLSIQPSCEVPCKGG